MLNHRKQVSTSNSRTSLFIFEPGRGRDNYKGETEACSVRIPSLHVFVVLSSHATKVSDITARLLQRELDSVCISFSPSPGALSLSLHSLADLQEKGWQQWRLLGRPRRLFGARSSKWGRDMSTSATLGKELTGWCGESLDLC